MTKKSESGKTKDLFPSDGALEGHFIGLDEEPLPLTLIVNKSNKLIAGQAKLTLNQQKLLSTLVGHINPKKKYGDLITVELTATEIASQLDMEIRLVRRFIGAAAKAFHEVSILLPTDDPEDYDVINIAHRSRYSRKNDMFTIQFHKEIEPELLNLVDAGYGRYDQKNIRKLRSNYSFRLYELFIKFYNFKKAGTQFWTAPLEDLYFPLGLVSETGQVLKPSYTKSFKAFRTRILDMAIQDLTEQTDLYADYKTINNGPRGSVTAIQFRLYKKSTIDTDGDSIEEQLLSLGVNKSSVSVWVEEHDEQTLRSNLKFLEGMINNGLQIRNSAALYTYCLTNNLAGLPDTANPYSKLYKKDLFAKEFIRKVIVPIWWKLDTELQNCIATVEDGFYSTIYGAGLVQEFQELADNLGIDQALMTMDEEYVIAKLSDNYAIVEDLD